MRLTGVRRHLAPGKAFAKAAPAPDIELFRRSLQLAKAATDRWRGRMIVVLLPSYEETVRRSLPRELRHQRLAALVRQLGISSFELRQRRSPDAGSFRLHPRRASMEAGRHFGKIVIQV